MNTSTSITSFESLVARAGSARVVVLFLFHAIVFAGCYGLAWLLRFEFDIPSDSMRKMQTTAPFMIGTQLLIGAAFGFYRGWWRYVGVGDVLRLVFGMTTALAVGLLGFYVGEDLGLPRERIRVPRGVLLIDWAFVLLSLFGTRVVIRVGRDRFRPHERPAAARRVLIIGAGDAGETLAREIEHRPQLGMKVVAFVDDQRAKWRSHIRGIKVTGPISDIGELADSLNADEALLAIPSASGKRIREIIHHLSEAELPFKTIPGIDRLVNGSVEVAQIRPVNVEDLLRRKRIELPGDPVRAMFRGKRVMVTGAGGTIGGELASQILAFEPESLVLLERSEYLLYEIRKRLSREYPTTRSKIVNTLVDVQRANTLRTVFEAERPEIVLHAAAHKHVPLGEENAPEYVRNNTLATRTLAEICAAAKVERFVLISTDKAINPTSVMGASKRAAEILLLDLVRQHSSMKATAVRFGNVIGSSGSVIPLFMEQIAQGGPVTVTHPDVTRYFLRTSEAVSLVLQAATLTSGGDVFMLDMGEPVRIAELARDLIRLSTHREEEIPIVFTGLRPGEKLFEEVRLHDESMRPTVHPQIVVTAAPQPDPAMVQRWISRAEAACEVGGTAPVAALHELIPEYAIADVHRIPVKQHRSGRFDSGQVHLLQERNVVSAG